MEKSKHNYPNSKIPYEELTNFINPIEMTITIPFSSLGNIVGPFSDKHRALVNNIKGRYSDLYSNFPFLKSSFKKMESRSLKPLRNISYTPHLDGYDFRLHPVDITNSLFISLGYKHRIPFINLDDKLGLRYLRDYAYSYYNDILRREDDSLRKVIVNELKDKYNKICDEYKEPVDIRPYVMPKDTLFFLAYRSLDLYEKTEDTRYLIFAKEYYDNVSDMSTSDFPHMITRYLTNSRLWFSDYRKEYEENVPKDLDLKEDKLELKNKGVLIGYEILKPGEVEKIITDTVKRTRAESNVDYKKYQNLFEQKMNFYLNKPCVRTIMGLYGLKGYMGFAYKNEYLVFDKFYNTDYENIKRTSILTHGEAIYALPSDRFSLLNGSTKQDIIEAKKTDTRIKKLNHTDTFIPRVERIIDGPNVSKSTLDEELDKTKVLILK